MLQIIFDGSPFIIMATQSSKKAAKNNAQKKKFLL